MKPTLVLSLRASDVRHYHINVLHINLSEHVNGFRHYIVIRIIKTSPVEKFFFLVIICGEFGRSNVLLSPVFDYASSGLASNDIWVYFVTFKM
jgi:hypothetical protein